MMQAQQMTPGQQIAMAEASGSQPNQPTPPGMQNAMMQTSAASEQMPMQSEEPAVENQESTAVTTNRKEETATGRSRIGWR